jgi:hypothetical protein
MTLDTPVIALVEWLSDSAREAVLSWPTPSRPPHGPSWPTSPA